MRMCNDTLIVEISWDKYLSINKKEFVDIKKITEFKGRRKYWFIGKKINKHDIQWYQTILNDKEALLVRGYLHGT